jgi:hypothetical protein
MVAAADISVWHNFDTVSSGLIRSLTSSVIAFAAILTSASGSQSVTLAWDPNPETDIAGYRVKYGTAPGSYVQSIDIGNTTTATIPNLAEGSTYYFVVTARNTSASESAPSNEVSITVAGNQPPSVTMTSPTNGTAVFTPGTITLAANASDNDGTISRVEFFSDGTKVGEATSSPYRSACQVLAAGTYRFTARAIDDRGAATQSAAVLLTAEELPITAPSGISSVNYKSTTGVHLTVTGAAGGTQSILASTDLKNWTLLASVVNSTGTVAVNDPSAVNLSRRFYVVTDGTVTTEPVGFTKLRIAGKAKKQTSASSYLGINLVNPPIYQGTVTSRGSQSIGDAEADWVEDQFNGANGDCYLEIVSGPFAGITSDILATNAANKTLTIDDDLSSFLSGGERFKIRKHRTIADVFGKNNESGLKSSTSFSSSDEVRLFNPVTQTFLIYYFDSARRGWRTSADVVTDVSNTKLYLDQGVAIRRRATGDLTLIVTGAVKTGPTVVPMGANSNLPANMYPAGLLTLGNCGLYKGGTSGFAGASKVSSADEVQIWSGTAFKRYFYKTGGSGGIGWRNSANLSVDASNTLIPLGSSVYVVRKNSRAPFNWTIQQPF